MAKIESWLHCDLKKAVQVQELKGNVFSLDNNGSRIRVRIFDNGEKATVSGTVTAKCILADDSTVNVNGSLATVDGQSVASVDIPQGCLLVPGTIRIAIKLTDSSVITTLAAVISTVYRTSTDNVITPSAQIIADWNQEISDALAAQDAQIEVQDGKIDDLKSALYENSSRTNAVESIVMPSIDVGELELGSISSNGSPTSSTTRRRTSWLSVDATKTYCVSLPKDWYCVISNGIQNIVNSWSNYAVFTPTTNNIRIVVKYMVGGTDQDLTNISADGIISLWESGNEINLYKQMVENTLDIQSNTSNIDSIINVLRPTIDVGELELGSINSNGSNISSTTRRRTNWITVQQNGKYYVFLPENWYFVASDLTGLVVSSWANSSEFTTRTTYLRIAVKYNTVDPNDTASDADLTNISAENVITLKDMNSFNIIANKGFSEVGNNSSYPYTNVQDAITANPLLPVMVNYGEYETEVAGLGTDKKIIGADKDLCILKKTGGSYEHPPIEISGGIIKNLTINMVNDTQAEHFGYCIHSDDATNANKKLIVSNCVCDNDLYRTIGFGVRGGEEVIFEDCVFVGHAESAGQAVYIHNSNGTKATVRFRNCYFKAKNECLLLQGWGSDCNVDWEFIDCTCISETYGVGIETVWTDYVSGSTHDENRKHEFSGKFALLPTSHGNNIDLLNYSV